VSKNLATKFEFEIEIQKLKEKKSGKEKVKP
jgi:hypothetical protein